MISLVFIILFFFCLAIGVASILISYQFINNYDVAFLKHYFYYLIAFFAFAFYGIWGQLIIRVLLIEIDTSTTVIDTIANFLPILGIPFLFVSWIMLVNMSYSMFDLKPAKSWKYIQILLFIFMIAGAWFGFDYINSQDDMAAGNAKYFGVVYSIGFELIYYSAFLRIAFLNSKRKTEIRQQKLLQFSLIVYGAFLIRSVGVLFVFEGIWILGVILLIYFISNFIPVFYLKLRIDQIFIPIKAEHASQEKIDFMHKKFKITKREKQIVEEICLGKTNQQIADELFISLQTVKDHTHRIYSKIGINSRMQLVQMINS